MAESKSPYQKYRKTPHRYSEALNRWHSAAVKHDERVMSEAARDHNRYLRDVLGWFPDLTAFERMSDGQRMFWRDVRGQQIAA